MSAFLIPFLISCEKDVKKDPELQEQTTVESRSVGCDLTEEADLKWIKIYGPPCASLKFVFNGFKTGPKNCTFIYQDVRFWRTIDGNVKNFNSSWDTQYPEDRGVFYSTLDGYIFRKTVGNDVNIIIPSLLNTNANNPFEFVVESVLSISARVLYVCYYAEFDCEGSRCFIGPICFTDYIPCI